MKQLCAVRPQLWKTLTPSDTIMCLAVLVQTSLASAHFFETGEGLVNIIIFRLNTRQKVGNDLRLCAQLRLSNGNHWRSLGDSNPCFRRERRATGTSADGGE
jgi:hypothetical protein